MMRRLSSTLDSSANKQALAGQSTLNAFSDRFGGKTPVRVFFLDNSSKMFLLERSMTAKDLICQILEKYEVRNVDVNHSSFALYESRNGAAIDGALNLDDLIVDVVSTWTALAEAKLVFMTRLFVPSVYGLEPYDAVAYRLGKAPPTSTSGGHGGDSMWSPQGGGAWLSTEAYLAAATVVDAGLLRLAYLQSVYHVITGILTTSEAQCLELGAIHFLVKFSGFQSGTHIAGFLGNRIVEFIPVRHLKKGSKSLDQWELSLLEAARSLADELNLLDKMTSLDMDSDAASSAQSGEESAAGVPVHLFRRYLNIVFPMELFGCSFYRCQQKPTRYAPENPVLGVHHLGLMICDKTRNVVKRYHITELKRWGFDVQTGVFTIEVNPVASTGNNSGNSAAPASNGSNSAAPDDRGSVSSNGGMDFSCSECQTVSHLLTDYALAYVKEEEMAQMRQIELARQGPPGGSGGAGSNISHNNNSNSNNSSAPKKKISIAKTAETIRAAVRIQAMYRGYSLRRDWIREDAAIIIQSAYRGYRARKRVSDMIERLVASGQLSYY